MPKTGQAPQRSKPLSTSEILREVAEDYYGLAQDANGKADYIRTRNYLWLRKLADHIKGTKKR